ncbi:MAG: UPF0182 family protein [Actinomycetota bacterium]|nr:UPF0182 family protein [Actinomycetota bacterium]
MRTPQDLPRRLPRASRRTRLIVVVAVVVLIVLIASLRGLANFWTDYLWFQSVGFTSVFKGVLLTKVVLSVVFIAILFVLLMTSLTVADRLGPDELDPTANDLVVRYRDFAFSRGGRVRLLVSLIFAVLGGIGADRQWNHWDLFRYGINFGIKDPQFHRDVGFYVFRLPFIRFLIGWAFDATIVILLLTMVFHYLNGGINLQSSEERVRPMVKAHLSVLLGILAVIKAVSYYYDRLALTLSRSHVVDGATATSVHADSPAKFLLLIIALVSAILFLANIWRRGWVLPAVGVGLWALVSILIGAAYPALYQALRVKPSELTRETPYIADNIQATRAAYGLNNVVTPTNYQYSPTVSQSEIAGNSPQAQINQQTIANVRLLDPSVNLLNAFNKYQSQRAYYSFNDLDLDRYSLPTGPNGSLQETATVTSVRELNNQVPSGFVNQHLQYTHGYGAIQAPVSEAGMTSAGSPNFTLSGLPPASNYAATNLSPQGSQIYFGEGPDTGGYVIADSKSQELNYEDSSGRQTYTNYKGSGGVDAGSLVRRAAFALRFGDANFLLSGQITSSSKVMYYRNILQRVQKAAPFLRYDSDPYSVVLNNQVYWIIDAYTITDNYPYSQEANLDGLPATSGLQTKFNYVRNSVKVVVSAYDGSMHFFDMGTGDPILRVYERAFPDLFTPVSQADKLFPGISNHWRYPENFFQIQTNMYGRYHLTKPSDFYSQAQAWAVSPDPGSGVLNNSQPIASTVFNNGQAVTQVNRLQPQYIEAALPGTKQQGVNFSLITPFVPISGTGSSQNLTGFMTASSDPGTYGQLTLYQLPAGLTVDGPGLISNAIRSNPQISAELTLYNQNASQVELGEVDVVPIDQTLLYIQPIYVESTVNHIPQLGDVVVVYNGRAYRSGNAGLDNALCQIQNPDGSHPFASTYCNTYYANFSSSLSTNPVPGIGGQQGTTTTTTPSTVPPSSGATLPSSSATIPPGATVQSLVAQADQDLANAQTALAQQNLGQYESYVQAAAAAINAAHALSGGTAAGGSTTTTKPTTPTTAPTPTSAPTG